MTRVYLLMEGGVYEGERVISIYTTRAKAEVKRDKYKLRKHRMEDVWIDDIILDHDDLD